MNTPTAPTPPPATHAVGPAKERASTVVEISSAEVVVPRDSLRDIRERLDLLQRQGEENRDISLGIAERFDLFQAAIDRSRESVEKLRASVDASSVRSAWKVFLGVVTALVVAARLLW